MSPDERYLGAFGAPSTRGVDVDALIQFELARVFLEARRGHLEQVDHRVKALLEEFDRALTDVREATELCEEAAKVVALWR